MFISNPILCLLSFFIAGLLSLVIICGFEIKSLNKQFWRVVKNFDDLHKVAKTAQCFAKQYKQQAQEARQERDRLREWMCPAQRALRDDEMSETGD